MLKTIPARDIRAGAQVVLTKSSPAQRVVAVRTCPDGSIAFRTATCEARMTGAVGVRVLM